MKVSASLASKDFNSLSQYRGLKSRLRHLPFA